MRTSQSDQSAWKQWHWDGSTGLWWESLAFSSTPRWLPALTQNRFLNTCHFTVYEHKRGSGPEGNKKGTLQFEAQGRPGLETDDLSVGGEEVLPRRGTGRALQPFWWDFPFGLAWCCRVGFLLCLFVSALISTQSLHKPGGPQGHRLFVLYFFFLPNSKPSYFSENYKYWT